MKDDEDEDGDGEEDEEDGEEDESDCEQGESERADDKENEQGRDAAAVVGQGSGRRRSSKADERQDAARDKRTAQQIQTFKAMVPIFSKHKGKERVCVVLVIVIDLVIVFVRAWVVALLSNLFSLLPVVIIILPHSFCENAL